MRITKFGHACLLIEEQGLRLLTDPGSYSTQQDEVEEIDLVIITHEHGDHLDLASLKRILEKNPHARVIANPDVCASLEKDAISAERFSDGTQLEVKGVKIEGVGTHHAFLHPSVPQILNTGYVIAGRLFYPGDAFTLPPYPVDVLALPVAAPWMRLAEAIDFASELKPKVCFPVHDGILKSPGLTHVLPPRILEPEGIQWVLPELGVPFDV